MATTRTTKVGYGSKLGDSIKGIFGGIIAIIISVVLLWWNEGNSVRELKKVAEGRKNTVEIESNRVLSDYEGSLVHLSGFATTDETLTDPSFGIAENAIALIREVELFQYKENVKKEEKENLGGSTTVTETFTYEEVWSSSLISSDNFAESWRKNPKQFSHKEDTWYAKNVTLGAFTLSDGILNSMRGYTELSVNSEKLADTTGTVKLDNGKIYFGADPKYPQIGDERITYKVLYPQDISLIAQQNGNSFKPYKTKVGKTIQLVAKGKLSADEMYVMEEQQNAMIRWLLRLLGFGLMFGGFSALFRPLAVAGSVVPFIGKIVGFGTGIIAFVLAFTISIIIIAIAWIVYRPLMGIALLAVGIGAFFLAKKYIFDKRKNEQALDEAANSPT